jgi:hypothetical protein
MRKRQRPTGQGGCRPGAALGGRLARGSVGRARRSTPRRSPSAGSHDSSARNTAVPNEYAANDGTTRSVGRRAQQVQSESTLSTRCWQHQTDPLACNKCSSAAMTYGFRCRFAAERAIYRSVSCAP